MSATLQVATQARGPLNQRSATPLAAQAVSLRSGNLAGQFVTRCRALWEMGGQRFARFLDRFDDGAAEFFVSKMGAHGVDKPLPKLLAAFFVNGFIANDSELARSRCHKNENRVALGRFVDAEPVKFFLGRDQRIDIQLSTLNINADLARSFCLGF